LQDIKREALVPFSPFIVGLLTITLVVSPLVGYLATPGLRALPIVCVRTGTDTSQKPQWIHGTYRTYITSFPLNENPISEGGNWVNGGSCGSPALCPGLDFSNVKTHPNFAYGTQTGAVPPPYTDSTALLTGRWGNDQSVQVVVGWDGASSTKNDYDEVELRLRSTLAAHWNSGYLINCRIGTPSADSYIQMGRANGPPNDFTWPAMAECHGVSCGCPNGTVITGTVANNSLGQPVISAYINGRLVAKATDTSSGNCPDQCAIQSGAPGFGFFHQNTSGQNSDFGICSFAASDSIP
jgi:hypothetical protein